MYPPEVIDHFERPRNVGELADADAQAEVENPACGDIMRLAVKVMNGRIEAVRYKTRGCVAAIASGSALSEMVEGKSLGEARALRREELVTRLGGLTPASMHASHLAMDCLSAVLKKLDTYP